MDNLIGIYDNHEAAVAAVAKLKNADFPIENLSILGSAGTEVVDSELHITEKNPLKLAELAGTTTVGTALGILTGLGLFSIPGLGFIYGSGALIGAIAGFDFGLIGGGIASVLATVGVKDESAEKYSEALAQNKFIVLCSCDDVEIERAHKLLAWRQQD